MLCLGRWLRSEGDRYAGFVGLDEGKGIGQDQVLGVWVDGREVMADIAVTSIVG